MRRALYAAVLCLTVAMCWSSIPSLILYAQRLASLPAGVVAVQNVGLTRTNAIEAAIDRSLNPTIQE